MEMGRTSLAMESFKKVIRLTTPDQPMHAEATSAIARLSSGNSGPGSSQGHGSGANAGAGAGAGGFDLTGATNMVKEWLAKGTAWLATMNIETNHLLMGIIAVLLAYIFFFSGRSSSVSDLDYEPYYDGGYSGGGGYGMSWSRWLMIMGAAWRLPPMFPDLLGDYARPFFGMNWMTFTWLLRMFGGGGGGGGGMGGMFGGRGRGRRGWF